MRRLRRSSSLRALEFSFFMGNFSYDFQNMNSDFKNVNSKLQQGRTETLVLVGVSTKFLVVSAT
jgi:hypothetical protein